jgi:hypothetical protein
MSAEEGQQYPPTELSLLAQKGVPADPKPVRAPELDTCNVAEAIGPAFDPYRVLLRRLFFIADDKSKYVSVGYYPARNYQPFVEFGGAKKMPMLLNDQHLQTMALHITALCAALCNNEYYIGKDGDYRMNTTGSYKVVRVYLGKQYLSFTLEELRQLLCIMYIIRNQMTFYIAAKTDVIAYVNTAHGSTTYVEPNANANTSIHYYQLFEELKSVF